MEEREKRGKVFRGDGSNGVKTIFEGRLFRHLSFFVVVTYDEERGPLPDLP